MNELTKRQSKRIKSFEEDLYQSIGELIEDKYSDFSMDEVVAAMLNILVEINKENLETEN